MDLKVLGFIYIAIMMIAGPLMVRSVYKECKEKKETDEQQS